MSDDEEAVRRVLAEYSHHYDSGSADEWAGLFAGDGRFVISGKATEGRSAIRGYMRDAQARFGRGLHLTSNIVVDVVGAEATASSDYLYVRPGTDGPVVVAAGHYRDRLVRDGDRWRFHERSVTLLGVPEPGADG